MLGAIKHGLTNLTNFNGRDARQTFWFYVLFLVIVQFALSMLITVPMMGMAMSSAVSGARQGIKPEAMQAQMFEAMSQYMPMMMWFSVILGLVTVLFLVASVVRRLHDSNLSGWFAALPAALYLASIAQMPAQMKQAMETMATMQDAKQPDPAAMMQGQGAAALLGYIPLIIVIYFGVRGSTIGPNQYGDEPVEF